MKNSLIKSIGTGVAVFTLCLGLVACGGKDEGKAQAYKAKSEADKPKYELKYESTEEQKMSEEKVEKASLSKFINETLEGNTLFLPGKEPGGNLTYEDCVAKIGKDANTYFYDDMAERRNYLWLASDDDTAQLLLGFKKDNDKWLLSMAGSTNLN